MEEFHLDRIGLELQVGMHLTAAADNPVNSSPE
jgi:hypothetical protein